MRPAARDRRAASPWEATRRNQREVAWRSTWRSSGLSGLLTKPTDTPDRAGRGSRRTATESGGVLEPVVAPEQLVVDRERRHPEHPELKGGLGRAPQRLFQRVAGSGDKSITVDSDPLTAPSTFAAMLMSHPCRKALRNAWSVNSRPLPIVNEYVAARIAVR